MKTIWYLHILFVCASEFNCFAIKSPLYLQFGLGLLYCSSEVISLYNDLSHTRIAGGFLFRFRSFFRRKNSLAQLAKAITKRACQWWIWQALLVIQKCPRKYSTSESIWINWVIQCIFNVFMQNILKEGILNNSVYILCFMDVADYFWEFIILSVKASNRCSLISYSSEICLRDWKSGSFTATGLPMASVKFKLTLWFLSKKSLTTSGLE